MTRERQKERVTVQCDILRETEQAMLIEVEEEEIWIPLSQVHKIVRQPNDYDEVTMTAWIAKKKGLA